MFAQVLYALEGAPSVRGLSCPFTDAGGSWYTDAVIWAYNAGVVAGVSPTRFAPNEALTREQMVTMLYGYAGREQALRGSDGALAGYQDQARVSNMGARGHGLGREHRRDRRHVRDHPRTAEGRHTR